MTYRPCDAPTSGPCARMREYQAECKRLDPAGASLGIYNRRRIAGPGSAWSVHACGRALDWSQSAREAGDRIVAWLTGPSGPADCQLVIWQRRIWSRDRGRTWRDYHGSDPHTGHIHMESDRCSPDNPAA